jgi:hypothetical protein
VGNPVPTRQPGEDSAKVAMGSMKAFIPSPFIHPLVPIEAALEDFLTNPRSEALGPEWILKAAFDLHLGS